MGPHRLPSAVPFASLALLATAGCGDEPLRPITPGEPFTRLETRVDVDRVSIVAGTDTAVVTVTFRNPGSAPVVLAEDGECGRFTPAVTYADGTWVRPLGSACGTMGWTLDDGQRPREVAAGDSATVRIRFAGEYADRTAGPCVFRGNLVVGVVAAAGPARALMLLPARSGDRREIRVPLSVSAPAGGPPSCPR